MSERTLSIIKPDVTERKLVGEVISLIEASGLEIYAMRLVTLTRTEAEKFYAVHESRPFFSGLVDFMISGPVVVSVLQGDDAIVRYRELMGATDPAKAKDGTIRKAVGLDIERNSVHGSDAPETAMDEIAFFFSGIELR